MARVIKIDNALQKRFSYKSNKKKEKRELRVYFLIVCEGEQTEPFGAHVYMPVNEINLLPRLF